MRDTGERGRDSLDQGNPGRVDGKESWYASFRGSDMEFKFCGPCVDANQIYWARVGWELEV